MGMTNRMKELTEDIQSSAKKRVEDMTRLKAETNTLRQEAVDMVQDFHDSRRKSGERLRNDLSQNEQKRQKEVGKMLSTFKGTRNAAAAELTKELAQGKAKTKAEVKETLADARTLINDFQSSRQTMGAELKKDLDKARDERITAVEGMREGFRQTRKEVQADLKGTADAWKDMGSAMRKNSSGGKGSAETQAVEITPNLEEKLLSIVNQHAEGISLTEVAKEIGVVTIVLGKTAKVLLGQGKIRREEKIYFPVTT